MMLPAPILLFVYNRPTHTLKTLNALRQNKLSDQSELFIFSDGYKSEADKAEVEKVRTLIRSVEGFKAVHIIENPH
ncbi:MAG TPA: glycosyltransferase family 2 protein, partial [Dysgonamonadaceae bacterium]|nr:glycosyltransferase family 2 protein [Dysgonamonadaceae bacterium]